ncbi:major facilitator superfamily domain-containing protein [Trichoderma afarasin]
MAQDIETEKPIVREVFKIAEEKPAFADSALSFLHEVGETTFTEDEEKKLVRVVDWMILPLLAAVYFLQFLDKNLINFANIMGLGKDTNSTPSQFSDLALVFYVAYLVSEPLSSFLLQRLPVAKFLGINVILWGLCLALNSVCKTYASLVALRVLLGIFEACVSPSMIIIICMWYKRREQPLRIGFFCGTVGLGIIVGALCSYGFQHYHGNVFKSWQIMFLAFGLVTIAVGILLLIFLPDNPMTSRLSNSQKAIAVIRLRNDTTGIENKTFKPSQFFEALRDPHTWLICLLTTAINIPNAAVSTFQATIIQGLGYTATQAALISIPSGVIGIIAIWGAAYTSFKFNNRSVVIILLVAAGILGGGLMAFLPSQEKVGRLIGTYLTNTIPSTTPIIYSWVAANIAGHTKKITVNAMLLMAFCLGNIIGPLTFTNPPAYTAAKITIVTVLCFAVAIALLLVYLYHRNNVRRMLLSSGDNSQATADSSFLDLTDQENENFIFFKIRETILLNFIVVWSNCTFCH